MSEPRDIPYILYLDFPDGEDNHLRKLAGIRRYALTRDWEVQTMTREELDREACDGLTAAALASRFDGSRRLFELRFRETTGHSVLDEILHAPMAQGPRT